MGKGPAHREETQVYPVPVPPEPHTLPPGASALSTHPPEMATSYLNVGGQRVAGELKSDLVIPLKHGAGVVRSHRMGAGWGD